MFQNQETQLAQELKRAHKHAQGVAGELAKGFDALIDFANDWKFQDNIKKSLKKLAPQMDGLLKKNSGVLLRLTYDKLEQTPGRYIPQFLSLSVAGAGSNARMVMNQNARPSFRAWNGKVGVEGGCRPSQNRWCKRYTQYIWKTRYSMEYLKP